MRPATCEILRIRSISSFASRSVIPSNTHHQQLRPGGGNRGRQQLRPFPFPGGGRVLGGRLRRGVRHHEQDLVHAGLGAAPEGPAAEEPNRCGAAGQQVRSRAPATGKESVILLYQVLDTTWYNKAF